MTSEVLWRTTWPWRLLEAICTWIPEYSGLLILNMRSYDLHGCFEATMASEAVGGNMYTDTRVIQVVDFKSEVKWPPMLVDVIEHHLPISHSPCRRRSIGQMPSCLSPALLSWSIVLASRWTSMWTREWSRTRSCWQGDLYVPKSIRRAAVGCSHLIMQFALGTECASGVHCIC